MQMQTAGIAICLLVLQILRCTAGSWADFFGIDKLSTFPGSLLPWYGAEEVFLGSGIKYKTIVFIHIQIYEVALYVEEKGAKAEFWRLSKAGFFKTLDEETLCSALLEGKFSKLLQIRLLRSVTSSQLTGEIGRDLEPRLARTGNEALWLRFKDYVDNKSLEKGSNFMALVHEDGSADGGIFVPDFTEWKLAKPDLSYGESAFGQALLDIYIGSGRLVKDARSKWAEAAKAFLPRHSKEGNSLYVKQKFIASS